MSDKRIDRQDGRQSGLRKAEESFEVEEVEFDPTRRGYTPVPNYFAYFWTPLLGAKAALTYERICSYAHGGKDECYPSVGLLADILGIDRHDLTGRVRRDRRPGRQGEYYQKGLFQILAEHGLLRIAIEERKHGRHYKFNVLKYPPLLSPEQIAQLPPRLQRKHQELLDRCQQERAEFARPLPPLPAGGGDAATGGGVTPPQGGCDAATPDLNSTNRTAQTKHLSPPAPEEREKVKDFYKKIGQPRISRQKLEAGVQILIDLKKQGFSMDELGWGISWIIDQRDRFGGEVHSLGLLPQVISQALQEREKVRKAEEKRRLQEQEERRLEAELARRQELEALYRSLPPTEQKALRDVAVENLLHSGVAKRFLLEPLVHGEICRLLEERDTQRARITLTTASVPAS
jgi:hypothetical protein